MTDIDIHDVESIEFGIFTPEEIRAMAVCKIDSNKLTGPGSVYDDRMGYNPDTNDKCVTCGLKRDCLGHFGYIDLVEPVLHPMFYKIISIFLKCFCKQCHRLLLIEEQMELTGLNKLKGERRFAKMLEKLEKTDICSHCSAPQPKIIYKSKDMTIGMEYKQKKGDGNSKVNILFTVEDVKKIFDDISDSDVEMMGFDPKRTHPRSLVLTVLPVIPPCSRPYVIADGNTCDDDLTYQLIEIVKLNNQLGTQVETKDAKQLQKHQENYQKWTGSLKFRIQTMMVNSKGRAKHPTDSRPLKGIKERLVGKGGRLRGNLMGKRVDYSARTVIGAEPTLKLGQLGIPYEVAQIHTKPETVTEFNIKWLTDIVNKGEANFLTTIRKKKNESGEEVGPEIKTRVNLQYAMFRKGTELIYGDIIVRGNGKFKINMDGEVVIPKEGKLPKGTVMIVVQTGNEVLKDGDRLIRDKKWVEARAPERKKILLKVGDIVERHLRKGDIVLFNRQPTLHRGSMLAMEVVPMPHKTFRFNLAATKSFNADFDGDEMNVHAPQSYETEAELRYLAASQQHIISAQESKPIIVITQDALVASFLMTRRTFKLSRAQFIQIAEKGERPTGEQLWNPLRIKHIERTLKECGKKPDIFNGRGLFSLILPQDLNYEKKNNVHPDEPTVKIIKGVFIEGAFDKSTLGSAHGSLIQILNKEYGTKVTSNFIDNVQFMGAAWLLVHGFSIGLEDCMITSEDSVSAIRDTLTQCYTKAEGIEETTQNPGIREVRVTASLSQAKDIGMRIAKDAMRPENNFLVTVHSGAKGDYFNIAQLTGLLGQQNLEGHRVIPALNHGKRTLPHYPFEGMDKETEYESKGFVHNSFIHGLNPMEFFFHAMSGREGVSDTAMSTAKSGYIQRKIVKVCEDIQVQYDQTVRDATGKIYQFAYGEDNYDPVKTVRLGGVPITCDIARLAERLNTSYEMGIEDQDDENDPLITASVVLPPTKNIEQPKVSPDKQKLIDKIRKNYPGTIIDEDLTVHELRQRLQTLHVEDEKESDNEYDEEDITTIDDEDDITTITDEQDEDNIIKDDEEEEEKDEDDEEDEEDEFIDDEVEISDEDFAGTDD
jgi:DNA-directed RNA polymerase beta' subunit